MSYPLLLTREELAILRSMVKTCVTNRILDVAQSYRRTVTETLNAEPKDMAREDELFVGRINSWVSHRVNLDLPLIDASLRIRYVKGTVVIVNLEKDEFEALKVMANLNYRTDGSADEDANKLIARLQVTQPAIKAAFEVAEANEKAIAIPTMHPAEGQN